MWVYLLLLVVVAIILLFSMIYIVKLTHKYVSKKIKNKLLSWLISFIPVILLIIGVFIDITNVIVIYLHLIVIIFITKLIFKLINKITNKKTSEYVVLITGIVISCIVLLFAYYSAYHVVETNYMLYTEKDIGLDNFKLVQISDSHIGTTMDGKKFSNYMEDINKLNPDIVVITGDFIDDNTTNNDLIEASIGLGKLRTKYGVYFIYGNHDKGYYNRNQATNIKDNLIKNNVIILEDAYINITDKIILVGRQDKSVNNRVDITTLTKDIDKSKYIIVLDHQPNDYDNEEKAKVDLVLSGHTHGGQLIPLGQFGVLLGSNDRRYGIETRDTTTFIVNSGISDWAIKFKTGTKSEYVVVNIKKKIN